MKNQAEIKQFGKNVRKLRLDRGLTQEELAAKAEFHLNYIGLIENGRRGANVPSIAKLVKALGCDISDLFKGLI